MTDIEVALTNIGEIATRDIAREEKPQGLRKYESCKTRWWSSKRCKRFI